MRSMRLYLVCLNSQALGFNGFFSHFSLKLIDDDDDNNDENDDENDDDDFDDDEGKRQKCAKAFFYANEH